jgi:Spy/CpxP family protein refolding chaperone
MEKVHGELPCCRSNKSVERFIIKVEITMKSMLKCMAATLLLTSLCSTGFAAEEQKPQPAPSGPVQMGGMGGMMGGMSEEQMDQRIRSMQEHMLKMHNLIASDPRCEG